MTTHQPLSAVPSLDEQMISYATLAAALDRLAQEHTPQDFLRGSPGIAEMQQLAVKFRTLAVRIAAATEHCPRAAGACPSAL